MAAPNARAAAEYYPPSYWYSLAKVPDKSEFPGTGPKGNGISDRMKSQADWLNQMRCGACHTIGTKATREIPKSLGTFHSSVAAWERRVKSGQMGTGMAAMLAGFGPRGMAMYADWTDRIAAGEVPEAPPRPQGVERNVVVSMWDWSNDRGFVHDTISTDKRNPTLNPNGPVYSISRFSAPDVNILDPKRHAATGVTVPIRDKDTEYTNPQKNMEPSPYWGEEIIWSGQASLHNPMLDHTGRVWLTHAIRGTANPAWCKQGSSHPSAQNFPINTSGRHLSVMDPKTKQVTMIDTCFGTHHLQFAEDANHTLYFSGSGPVVAWFNTKLFDQTKDEQKAQGWAPYVIDTNGNGKRDAYVEPNQPTDPTKDRRFQGGSYGVIRLPGRWVGLAVVSGRDLPLRGKSERPPRSHHSDRAGLQPAADHADGILRAPVQQREVARQWVYPARDQHRSKRRRLDRAGGQRTSGQLRPAQVQGSLERTGGDGQHCVEGWTLHVTPGPKFKGVTDESTRLGSSSITATAEAVSSWARAASASESARRAWPVATMPPAAATIASAATPAIRARSRRLTCTCRRACSSRDPLLGGGQSQSLLRGSRARRD